MDATGCSGWGDTVWNAGATERMIRCHNGESPQQQFECNVITCTLNVTGSLVQSRRFVLIEKKEKLSSMLPIAFLCWLYVSTTLEISMHMLYVYVQGGEE